MKTFSRVSSSPLFHVSCVVRATINHSTSPIITIEQPPPHRIPINRHFPAISSLFADGTPYLYNRWSDDRSRSMSINGHTRGCPPIPDPAYAPKRRGRTKEQEESSRGDVDTRLCPRPSEAAHPGARGDKKREPGHVQSGGSRVSTRQDARRHSSLINGQGSK